MNTTSAWRQTTDPEEMQGERRGFGLTEDAPSCWIINKTMMVGAVIDANDGEQPFRRDRVVFIHQLSKSNCLRIRQPDISLEASPGALPSARCLLGGRYKSKARI